MESSMLDYTNTQKVTYDPTMLDFKVPDPKSTEFWQNKYPGFDPIVHQIFAFSCMGMKPKEFRSRVKAQVKKEKMREKNKVTFKDNQTVVF